METVVIKIEVV